MYMRHIERCRHRGRRPKAYGRRPGSAIDMLIREREDGSYPSGPKYRIRTLASTLRSLLSLFAPQPGPGPVCGALFQREPSRPPEWTLETRCGTTDHRPWMSGAQYPCRDSFTPGLPVSPRTFSRFWEKPFPRPQGKQGEDGCDRGEAGGWYGTCVSVGDFSIIALPRCSPARGGKAARRPNALHAAQSATSRR